MKEFTQRPEVLAIIPARGGSKGIPRKNVVNLCGRPLIEWTIEAARSAERVSRVVVSTDDAEISAISQRAGAEVIERPADISGDSASSEAALLHTLSVLKVRENYSPELIAFLQCTSPLTTARDIDSTIETLLKDDADTAAAVVSFHYFLWKYSSSGLATGVNHDKSVRLLRQDREPEFLEAGAVYAIRTAGFLEARHRFFGKTSLYEMPQENCWEIDTPVDLKIAEVLLQERLSQSAGRG